jgi:hypothetical protein
MTGINTVEILLYTEFVTTHTKERKLKWLRRPVDLLWCFIALWLLLSIRPISVEMLGASGAVISHKAVLIAHDSNSGKTHYTEHNWSNDTYDFKLAGGGEASITLSERVKPPNIPDSDNVDLGFALGEIATINGQFVAPIGFFELLTFAISCPLILLAVVLTRARRQSEAVHVSVANTIGYGAVLLIAAVPFGIPALIAGMILSLIEFAWWPLLVVGVYALLGYAIGRKLLSTPREKKSKQ